MSKMYGKRLPGIEGRLEFTNRFMLLTLRNVRAKTAELIMEMSRLKELQVELDSYASPEYVSDEEAAIMEFNEIAEAVFQHCYSLRERLDEKPPVFPAEQKAPMSLPEDPGNN